MEEKEYVNQSRYLLIHRDAVGMIMIVLPGNPAFPVTEPVQQTKAVGAGQGVVEIRIVFPATGVLGELALGREHLNVMRQTMG